ncbi:MAG: hypothetical protein H7Y86_22455, partial [Rhizobacter sp.]|nr:hypothetical protein [Ferruginibacter sp.]
MKLLLLFSLCLCCWLATVAQQGVSIGSSTVHPSAVLDMSKSTKGVAIPRLTQTARLTISNPAEGLLVYDSTTNRMYQYQDGLWRYLLNNTYWTKSASGNYAYTFDSVGLATSSPDARLEVVGNIRGRAALLAADNVSAGNLLHGDNLLSSGTLVAAGTATINGNITTQGNVNIDNTSPILQLKSSGDNRVFIQESGDDLRLGTNSGNTTGKTIIRMNGNDVVSIDTTGSLKVLTSNGGNINMGRKLMRYFTPAAAPENTLPVIYGMVYNNSTSVWMSVSGTIMLISTGVYEVSPQDGRPGARSAILVTPRGASPRVANAYM